MEYLLLTLPIILFAISFLFIRYNSPTNPFKPIAVFPITIIILFLVLIGLRTCNETHAADDTEYWGSYIVKAEYYEYWETWVEETCTESYACGTDSKGNTQYCTRTYDCSYCDKNSEKYYKIDNLGNKYSITKSEYEALIKKWKIVPKFIDLNRNINNHFFCGKDGDKYEIVWDKNPYTVDAITTEHHYKNKTQAVPNLFKFNEITDDSAIKLGLYNYPPVIYRHQPVLLGYDEKTSKSDSIRALFDWLNASDGSSKQIRVYVMLFRNQYISKGFQQEEYWKGGNKNELNICVGLDNQNNIAWVHPFSWTGEKQILVDLREDIQDMKVLDWNRLYDNLNTHINHSWKRKEFKSFDYIDIPLSNWFIFWMIFISIVFSIVAIIMCFGEWRFGNKR